MSETWGCSMLWIDRLSNTKWRRAVARVFICVAVVWTLYEVGGTVLDGINIIFWRQECQERSWVAALAGWSLPVILFVSLWLQAKAIRYPSRLIVVVAVLLPIAGWGFHRFAAVYEAGQLRQCAARPLVEAIKVCNVDLSVYRKSIGHDGRPVFTLIPPGNTDAALSCFERWANWSNKASVNIDDSVYVYYRRTHR